MDKYKKHDNKAAAEKILNHTGGWIHFPLYHSINWVQTDMLVNYNGREYIFGGLTEALKIEKCILISSKPELDSIPINTLVLFLDKKGEVHYYTKYKDPYRNPLGPFLENKNDYLIWDRIRLLLRQNPIPALTAEEQSGILNIASNSGDLVEYNSYQAMVSVPIMDNDNVGVIYSEVMNLMSILSWCYDGYVDVDESKNWAYKSPSSFCRYAYEATHAGLLPFSYGFNIEFLPIITDEKINTSLAFWREGVKLKSIHSGFSFLSFFKAIESQFNKGDKNRAKWINENINKLLHNKATKRIEELKEIYLSNDKIGKYLFDSVKCAVSHASINRVIINPDIAADKERVLNDLPIMEALAEKYIKEKLSERNL